MPSIKTFTGSLVIVAAFVTNPPGIAADSSGAFAEPYPTRIIKVIVPYPPGGGGDVVARLAAHRLEKTLGQSFVVENRPGAAGSIGAASVARSKPDGYTILATASGVVVGNPHIYASTPFDTLRDFEFISQIADVPIVLVVHPSLPVHSIHDYVALAKKEPNKVTYASGGVGTIGHLVAELFMIDGGITLFHIPYKGTPPALLDVLAGRAMSMFDQIPTSLQHIKAGRLRALAVTNVKRHPLLPDVPTTAEAGYKKTLASSWYGLLAPAKTPMPIITKLSQAVATSLATPGVREAFAELGMDPATSTPGETRAYIASELEKWGLVVKKAGIKVE